MIALLMVPALVLAQKPVPAAETFVANGQITGLNGTASAAAIVTIQIDRYSDADDIKAMQDALKFGGYPKFLTALRKAPVVGSVEMVGHKELVRWARQVPTDKGRTISVVTEKPIAFIGGAGITPKSRAGFELAVLQFDVDASGSGSGMMAAAARVRPGGTAGVQLDDYAETPIKLASVRKSK
jgi:hypothetical protein